MDREPPMRLVPAARLPTAIVMVCLLASACESSKDQPAPSLDDATRSRISRALESSGDLAGAAQVLRGPPAPASEKAPDTLTHAEVLIDAGQVDKGMTMAKAAMAKHGDDPMFAVEVARLAILANRLTEAADIYQDTLRRHPDSVEALNGYGVVLAQQGNLAGAGDKLRVALKLRPKDAPVLNNLALVLLLSGQNAEAVTLLESMAAADRTPQIDATLALAHDRLQAEQTTHPLAAAQKPTAEPLKVIDGAK